MMLIILVRGVTEQMFFVDDNEFQNLNDEPSRVLDTIS